MLSSQNSRKLVVRPEENAELNDPYLVKDLSRLLGTFLGHTKRSPGLRDFIGKREVLEFKVFYQRDGLVSGRRLFAQYLGQLPEYSTGEMDYSLVLISPHAPSRSLQNGVGLHSVILNASTGERSCLENPDTPTSETSSVHVDIYNAQQKRYQFSWKTCVISKTKDEKNHRGEVCAAARLMFCN